MSHNVSRPLSFGTDAYPWPQPRRGEFDELVWDGLAYSAPSGHRPLFLDLHVPRHAPDEAPPLVVWLYGGGWAGGSRRRFSPASERHWLLGRILLAGFAAALVDYRLIREAPFPAPVADVRASLRWLRAHARELGIDPARFALWGESAGAHIACLAATCDRDLGEGESAEHLDQPEAVSAVVDWYGPADFTAMPGAAELFAEGEWDAAAVSPIRYVRPGLPAFLLVHGRDDSTVPFAQSRAYAEALEEAGVTAELVSTPGGHVFEEPSVMADATVRSLEFLRRELGVPARPAPPVPSDVVVVHVTDGDPESGAAEAARIAASVPATVVQVAAGPEGVRAAVERATEDSGARVALAGGSAAAAAALHCCDVGIDLDALLLLHGAADWPSPWAGGLPPTILGLGALDPYREDTLAFAYRLREADVPLTLRVLPELGDAACERLCRELNRLMWDGPG